MYKMNYDLTPTELGRNLGQESELIEPNYPTLWLVRAIIWHDTRVEPINEFTYWAYSLV